MCVSSEGGTVDGGRYDVRHGRSSLRARPLQLVPLTFTQSRQEKLRYHSWRIQSVSFHLLDLFIYILLRPRERLLSIVMSTSVSVCLSDREDISRTTRAIFTNFCACCLWPWLGPPPASLRHVMYFRFCEWHHAFFYSGPYSGMNFTTKDRFCVFYFFTVKSDTMQFPIIKWHNFD